MNGVTTCGALACGQLLRGTPGQIPRTPWPWLCLKPNSDPLFYILGVILAFTLYHQLRHASSLAVHEGFRIADVRDHCLRFKGCQCVHSPYTGLPNKFGTIAHSRGLIGSTKQPFALPDCTC